MPTGTSRWLFAVAMIRGGMETPWKYRFGPFELQTRAHQLFKDGTRVKLRGQPYQILELLLSRPGEVVTRDEIRNRLWPADTFVDFEHGLNTSVKKLRQVLCDSVEEPRYIETAPRLGYRFIAAVEVVAESPAPAALTDFPQPSAPATAALPPVTLPPAAAPRWKRAAVGLAVAIVVAGSIWFLKASGRLPWPPWGANAAAVVTSTGQIRSIAVLPLESLSNDPSQDYFTDGMTDELISDLAQLGSLRVISRTSAMHYKGSSETVPQIARELGVDAVVEGTVERVGDRVRIRVQLIDAARDRHLWARNYDHEFKDVLLLQSTAAHDIVEEIQGKIANPSAPVSPSPRSVRPDAYEAYLKGRYFWNKRTSDGLNQAIEYFNRSISIDPAYAQPYGGLAESYALMAGYSIAPARDSMIKARAAARRALELDEQLPEAHTALGYIAENYDWDWQTAEKEYRRAIQLNPNYATAHQWYAECVALQGRFNEAFPEIERARQLDPLSTIIGADYGVILYFSRQYDQAIAQFRSVLEMDPDLPRASMLTYAYVQKQSFNDAATLAQHWDRGRDSPWSWALLTYVAGRSGDHNKAERALKKFSEVSRGQHVDPCASALAYLGVDDREKALFYLKRGYTEHSGSLTALKVDPTYDVLRGDPRFTALLKSIGLAK